MLPDNISFIFRVLYTLNFSSFNDNRQHAFLKGRDDEIG